MKNYRLGRKQPVFTVNAMKASHRLNAVLTTFGLPPVASADFVASVKRPWGMFLNDSIGDCVVKGTRVSAPDANGAYKGTYSGPVVEIVTESGKRLTVTPNHGILTPRGFVIASGLQKGDDLIGTRGSEPLPGLSRGGGQGYVDDPPTPIEEKFSSLIIRGNPVSKVVPSSVDFHGDEISLNGDVDIVRADSFLGSELYSPLSKPHSKNQIGATSQLQRGLHRSGASFLRGIRSLSSALRDIGVGCHGPSFGYSHAGVPETYSLQHISNFVPSSHDRHFESPSRHPEIRSNLLHGFSGNISFNRLSEIARALQVGYRTRLSMRPELNAGAFQPSNQGVPTDPHLAGNLQRAFPLHVHIDRVRNIEIKEFEGHVYDLSTERKWYIAEGIVTHNCTCADAAHTLMMRTANTGTIVVPTDADILAMYEAVSGYKPDDPKNPQSNATDGGALESDVCTYMQTTGLCGHRSVGNAAIVTGVMGPTALDHIRWGIQVFGAVRIGVDLPASAEDQFDAGQPWTVAGDLTVEGGHDVCLVKYDGNMFFAVTWGKLQPVTSEWLTRFCTEAHVEVFEDFVRKSGTTPSGFGLGIMLRDMNALAVG